MRSRSRKELPCFAAILAIALLGTLATFGIAGAATTGKKTPLGLPAHSSLLFAMNAKAGTLSVGSGTRSDRYRLHLTGVDRRTVWFADRPNRDAGRLDTGRFFSGWGKLGFRADPPNAALVAQVGGRTRTMAVELKLRRYSRRDGSAAFDARVLGSLGGGLRHLNQALGAPLPPRLQNPTLFIDNGGSEPSCTLGETRLVAISPSYKAAIDGMIPAEGQTLSVDEYTPLFEFWDYSYGGSGQHFSVPNLSAPTGTTWFVCAEGFFPTSPSLSPSCDVGETLFWALPNAVPEVTSWLPADGRRVLAREYFEYATRFAGPEEAQVALPKVSDAPPGTTALTCLRSDGPFQPGPILGGLVLLPELQSNQKSLFLPASGGPVAKNSPIGALLEADAPLGGKTPNLPAAGPGANWFISVSGSWPLG